VAPLWLNMSNTTHRSAVMRQAPLPTTRLVEKEIDDDPPYEEFLAALVGRDLSRVRSWAACWRIFIALRSDQKACTPRCADRFRVEKFRGKQPEYLENRKFRRRTGLAPLRTGRHYGSPRGAEVRRAFSTL
jgi:hypothetical protein